MPQVNEVSWISMSLFLGYIMVISFLSFNYKFYFNSYFFKSFKGSLFEYNMLI